MVNIEKDQSNSSIIAAINLPHALDKALFRRFDDVVAYPLPQQEQIVALLEMRLSGYSFKEKVDFASLAKLAQGLNYSDLGKACEDLIKDMIIKGQRQLSLVNLKNALEKRRETDC